MSNFPSNAIYHSNDTLCIAVYHPELNDYVITYKRKFYFATSGGHQMLLAFINDQYCNKVESE